MPSAIDLPAIPDGGIEASLERLVRLLSGPEDEIQAGMLIALPTQGPAPLHGVVDACGVEIVLEVANIGHVQLLVSQRDTRAP